MIHFPNTLSFRLTLWYASLFVLFLMLALLVSYIAVDSILEKRMDDDLEEDIEEFTLLMSESGLQRVMDEIQREAGSGNSKDVVLRLFDSNNNEIFSSDLQYWPELHTNPDALRKLSDAPDEVIFETQQHDSREYSTRFIYGMIGSNTSMQIGESVEDKQEIMEVIMMVFALMFLIVLPIASYVGWFVARKAVRGIEAVSDAAIDIQRGEFDRRVTVVTHAAEIQRLVNTFNAMAERIRNLISEMREMIDNIAHDLRSPIARIRAISETTLNDTQGSQNCYDSAASTIDECDRLIQLINTTLDVAEAEADVAHKKTAVVDLSSMVNDACELFEPLAERLPVFLSSAVEPNCMVSGNKGNLQRMLANLLDNAIKYTPANGSVNVCLSQTEKEIYIRVSDSGVGIPETEQSRVFDRFYRCDQSRSQAGCGLGLSFARAVAKAHQGDIQLISTINKGSTFTVTLPRLSQ